MQVSTAVDSASAIKAMEKQGVAYVEDKEPAISCCGLFRAKPRVADPPPAVVASPVTSSQGLAVPSISHDASADVDEVPKAAVARKTGARQSHSEGGGTMGAPPSMTALALGTTSEGAGSPASAGFLDEVISISRRIMGSLSNRQDTTVGSPAAATGATSTGASTTTAASAPAPASAASAAAAAGLVRQNTAAMNIQAQLRGNAARKVTTELKSPHAESHQARQHL